MSQYIPDLTERFPEGFGGVDMTDRYFPSERCLDPWDALAELERYDDREDYDEEEEEDDEPYVEEPKDMEKFYENWGDQIDEDELPFI